MGSCFPSTEHVLNGREVDLSHFVIGSCIGQGGFGKVYAVLHKGTGTQMAMKRLRKNKIVGKGQWHTNSVWVERNLLEILDSPYINKLYFAFQTNWELVLVTPYYRGGDLNWYLSTKGEMAPEEIQYYGAELLLGHLCITDFGVSGQLEIQNTYKLNDKFGTAPYMSPEQYQGKPYDYCADYFAFGLILYEMATTKMLLESRRNIEAETDEFYELKLDVIQQPLLHDLIRLLLLSNREERIGNTDIKEIFNHPFFKGIMWDKFAKCEQTEKPPYIPNVAQINCSLECLAIDVIDQQDPEEETPPTEEQQKVFSTFEFNTTVQPEWTDHWIAFTDETRVTKRIDQLWNTNVDINAFTAPKSKYEIDFESIHIEFNKSIYQQIAALFDVPVEE